ncbi:DinB family protein [Spirosoma sp. 209]|uniref:DinB family protein n=1 Tax=Spirosoma sp. 209 TaxID=1955701 RepID=UPI00098D32F3|nr:DinB family protein [Spirosoma sp. 209]
MTPDIPAGVDRLLSRYQAFADQIGPYSEATFREQPPGKWSVAEVVQHLYLSARPVARLVTGPREVLLAWGLAEKPSRSYAQLAVNYEKALDSGVKAPDGMVPRLTDISISRAELMERLLTVYQSVAAGVSGWSPAELDRYQMPHPALGKLTVREMIDFISIHTEHHQRLLPAG